MGYPLAQSIPPKPYYPGFRDLNLFFVAICLIAFLYVILVGTIAYRVISVRKKLQEVDLLLGSAPVTDDPSVIEALDEAQRDRDRLGKEFEQLTATSPGRWFKGPSTP